MAVDDVIETAGYNYIFLVLPTKEGHVSLFSICHSFSSPLARLYSGWVIITTFVNVPD